MKLVTIAGPPSSGKTAVTLKAVEALAADGLGVGVVKFDSLSTQDQSLYEKHGVTVKTGLSGNLCPDHFFVSNVSDCLVWGTEQQLDLLVIESAGLCNRCAPHIQGVLAVCVIDNLSGVDTPKKIGPMLKMADVVVITKGDIVSQAEREVFAYRVRQVNTNATIINVNGLTGQGGHELGRLLQSAPETADLEGNLLRFSMPAALCSYCLGQRRIGSDFQMGNVKKMDF
ncbi:GTP-binding protein [Geotalea uraniireducens]|uniref:Cobalamin synthesis protein, P47K n=1 Tax=Geotalea uraniireducens (strain Rf4) TaxID=351605 RepID=A5G6R6_GEOUR|nr:GTP-binding protein [Geotalea uraniireducens]ABQ27484.1 cobalamin synthesis protein, P47K [Geotalea uraniireducens Rf4]